MLYVDKVVIMLKDGGVIQLSEIIHVVAFFELVKALPVEVAKEYAVLACMVWSNVLNAPSVERVAYLFAEYVLSNPGLEPDYEKVKKYVEKNYRKES